MQVLQQFRKGVPPTWGTTSFEGDSSKSAHTTRVVVCKVPSSRARSATCCLLWGVGVAAERRWELALWTLNPAIAVQICARSCTHRPGPMKCAVLFGRLAWSCWVWGCSRLVVCAGLCVGLPFGLHCGPKSWQHPEVFPGGPPPQY